MNKTNLSNITACQCVCHPDATPCGDCFHYHKALEMGLATAQGDVSLKGQIEKIHSDFKYHELNECATMDVPSFIPCDHTGCGGGRCKQELERVKHCNCGGDERYQADIKALLALFQSERTKAKEEVIKGFEKAFSKDNATFMYKEDGRVMSASMKDIFNELKQSISEEEKK